MASLKDEQTSTSNVLKLIFIIVILAVCLFFGYYPLFCKLTKKSTRYLGFFNSFSGGVFCGIGLFLLLPQSKEVMESWAKSNISDPKLQEVPYSFFICFAAYSFMLLIEKVLFSSQSLIPMLNGDSHGHSHAHEEDQKDIPEIEEHSHSKQDAKEDEDEEAFKNVVSAKGKFASFLGMRNCK